MLIIEDGTIIPDANSYTTDAELVLYAAERGMTIPATESERDILQVLAKDYIDGLDFKGFRADPVDQFMSYPRNGVFAYDRIIASDEIPKELKWSQMEAAIAAHTQSLLINQEANNVQSEEMDVLKVSYFSGGSWTKVRLNRVMNYIEPFLIDVNELQRT